MSKTFSRIPTFRSKLPTIRPKQFLEVTPNDIGKKVHFSDKKGTLRYVGNVHFSTGIWCGIELSDASGQNDGTVHGIRYFICRQGGGLMAPLEKVTLSEVQENVEDGNSGPFSMLFIKKGSYESIANDSTTDSSVINSEECWQEHSTEQLTHLETLNDRHNIQPEVTENRKSCDSLLVGLEVARSKQNICPREINRLIEKPSSFPQLRTIRNCNSIDCGQKLNYSTLARNEFEEYFFRKLHLSSSNIDDDDNKRNSLELEESLGILTPEQMIDSMSFMSVINSRTPSSECIGDIKEKINTEPKPAINKNCASDLASPVFVDASVTEFSLGIIDDHLMSNLTLKTDTTMNMELPLDTLNKSKDFMLTRLEQTPSPEELPLDPTPLVGSDTKNEPNKSKASNSFITSITSITSLDTGYQGDGEMSRPASRGADNSPLTKRPVPRLQTRKPDPMTDSDFYTESDADNHEENVLKGDRKAQVIDGTLYGVDPQAAADIYVNNRENMDSSGIFTDIETNVRNEPELLTPHNVTTDVSPSDTSSKTISGNSQNHITDVIKKVSTQLDTNKTITPKKDNPKKRNASSPVLSSPASLRSPRHLKEENATKKFKIPKREVPSKVKAMIQSSVNTENKNPVKKSVGRWDAVMNKISKTETVKTNVKSKVFNSDGPTIPKTKDAKRETTRQAPTQKSPNLKNRRVRVRPVNMPNKKKVGNSIHSSFSDVSASTPMQKNVSGASKTRETGHVTQVITPSKLPFCPVTNKNGIDHKKSTAVSTLADSKSKRSLVGVKEKKDSTVKECSRNSAKAGRTSPIVRPPLHTRTPPKPNPKVAEALAVLVQHLVYNVEAYQAPVFKRQIQKLCKDVEEMRFTCKCLEETLNEERESHIKNLEDERTKFGSKITQLTKNHEDELLEQSKKQAEIQQRLCNEYESKNQVLINEHENKLVLLKNEFERLQKTHEESLDILREENDAIREQIDEKNTLILEVKEEKSELKQNHEAKEMMLKVHIESVKNENQKLKRDLIKMEEKFQGKLNDLSELNESLKSQNEELFSYSDIKENGISSIQELQSLRVVLELKQNEVADLRRALAEETRKNENLAAAEEKSATLAARCEDLKLQLDRKSELELSLIAENKKLFENIKEEVNQNKRLSHHNEELKWKLRQNKEVVSKVLEQAVEESFLNRSFQSFNERHFSGSKHSLERTHSFREQRNYSDRSWNLKNNDMLSSSPKVKGVVEKSDSVSYVLDLDESPDVVASRIVRRSFRNPTPPKTTPTKSPSNKRPRMKFPLSLSASASAILPSNTSVSSFPNRSAEFGQISWMCSAMNSETEQLDLDLDEDDLMKLPALPSELERNNESQALPTPKHLAAEEVISESNSDDESSTSSSSVQL